MRTKAKRYPQDYTNQELGEMHFGKPLGTIKITFDCGDGGNTFVTVGHIMDKEPFEKQVLDIVDGFLRSFGSPDKGMREYVERVNNA